MDVFDDFHRYHDPKNPNNAGCLELRATEFELRMNKRIGKRNDWFGFAVGLIMLFFAGAPLELVWKFGLGEKIGNRALFFCCAGVALGLFLLTAPIRHRGRQRSFDSQLAAIEEKLVALNCPCASRKLDGTSGK